MEPLTTDPAEGLRREDVTRVALGALRKYARRTGEYVNVLLALARLSGLSPAEMQGGLASARDRGLVPDTTSCHAGAIWKRTEGPIEALTDALSDAQL